MGQPTRAPAGALHLLTGKAVCEAGPGDHSDGGGLVLRVQANAASWVFRYTAPSGKRREMGLGPARRTTAALALKELQEIRQRAQDCRNLLRDSIDPIDARDALRAEAKAAAEAKKAQAARERVTLARAARDYHARVIEPKRTPKHAAQWIASLENHIPPKLWHKPVDAIEQAELLAALLSIKPHERARNLTQGDRLPETMRRLRQRLDAVFEDAIFHKLASFNPAAAIRRKVDEQGPKRGRGAFAALPYREVAPFMARLRQVPGVGARCLEFAILTAARTSEALFAEWSEFDLEARVWTVPADRMKAGESHTVYLSDEAMAVLLAQRARTKRLVFPSPMSTEEVERPLSNMAMLTVLDRLNMRHRTTVHGVCRASFSTWAYETAAAMPDVIEACLAHREEDKVKAAYARTQFAEDRRQLLAVWARYACAPAAPVLAMPAAA